MGFFRKFFSNNKGNLKPIISFDVLNIIEEYLYNVNSSVSFKLKGINDIIYVNRYNFPDSFDEKEIKKAGFSNSFQVLNEIYKKVNISPVSNELISDGYECGLIHFQFNTKPTAEIKSNYNYILQNFLVFFCCRNSDETNSFEIFHNVNCYFNNYIKDLLNSKLIECYATDIEINKIGVNYFEKVLLGFFQHFQLNMPDNIEILNNQSLLVEEITVKSFEELLNLITRNLIKNEIIVKQAKHQYNYYLKNTDYNFTENNYEVLEQFKLWNSDCKFDPEDAEYFISQMIGFNLNFEYPSNTYSHDLFFYIQQSLAKHSLELMSFDTQGDNYLFFVCNKKDVDRILELSNATNIKIIKLI